MKLQTISGRIIDVPALKLNKFAGRNFNLLFKYILEEAKKEYQHPDTGSKITKLDRAYIQRDYTLSLLNSMNWQRMSDGDREMLVDLLFPEDTFKYELIVCD